MSGLEISVVIPTYNRANLTPRAVNSALASIQPGDEVIVVDDGSTDDTPARLASFGARIRYAQIPHAGAGAARNHGISMADKPLVAFLDSDDVWMPDKLDMQRCLMERRPDVVFCFSDFVSRESSADIHHYLRHWHQDPRSWDEILGAGERYSDIAPLPDNRTDFRVHFGSLYLPELERDYVATFTMMVRREQAGSALHFAEDVVTCEDWECFARLARSGTAAYMDCDTAWQYGHSGPRLTDDNANGVNRATWRLRILERVWGSDAAFLAEHGDRYARVCQRYRLQRAKSLLHQGQSRLARDDLRHCTGVPWRYRFAAAMPASLIGGLLGLRRRLRTG
ncbi:MAG: glycosyltransferase family A protein [Rhodanobacteraceae bacterium]